MGPPLTTRVVTRLFYITVFRLHLVCGVSHNPYKLLSCRACATLIGILVSSWISSWSSVPGAKLVHGCHSATPGAAMKPDLRARNAVIRALRRCFRQAQLETPAAASHCGSRATKSGHTTGSTLAFLEDYIAATHRYDRTAGPGWRALRAKLPKEMGLAKNREELLHEISRLRKKI